MSDSYQEIYGHPHRCHWPGCEREIPPARFACRPHWFALPGEIRAAIMGAYTKGQEGYSLNSGPRPSDAWLAAAKRAVEWAMSRDWKKKMVYGGEIAFRHPPMPEEKP